MALSVSDNTCECGCSRKQLYHTLQAGRLSPLCPDVFTQACDMVFMAGWRTAGDPPCIKGTRLSLHPHSQCGEHRRTLGIQTCAVVGLSLMCVAIGLSFTSDTGSASSSTGQCSEDTNATTNAMPDVTVPTRAESRSTSLHLALSSSCMSLLAVAVWRHVLDMVRARFVKWPNSFISAGFALAPLFLGVGLCLVAVFVSSASALLSVGCSISSMYVTELLSTVTSWKRQRHDRLCNNPDIEKTLRATYRSATVLAVGLVLPVALAIGVCSSNSTRPALILLIIGSSMWTFPMIYILCELKMWSGVLDSKMAPARFRVPVLGTVLLITPEKCSDSSPETGAPSNGLMDPLTVRYEDI